MFFQLVPSTRGVIIDSKLRKLVPLKEKWTFLIRGPLAWKRKYELREGLKENNSGLSLGLPSYNSTG